ncbi:MAG: DUF262 domain-containing protein [Chloroflexi bacterium]|nr:DUF262 domain-containing protein [Chloroflexota bacterium]
MSAGTIVVNRDYQRSPKVWPTAARSYLIDTVLSGYPVPKLALHQKTDRKSRKTIKEIVDGQQRSQTILDFYNDALKLSGKGDFAGNTYSTLEPEQQNRFLEYPIGVDLFVGATEAEIRQVFRRINSYTVPLNPQEKRHATYQGTLKWFIVNMSERYGQALKDMGVLSERQLSRMNDAALLTDILYTIEKGIGNASEPKLDDFYKGHDDSFDEAAYGECLDGAFSDVMRWEDTHRGPLMTSYNFYSLMLALIHVKQGPIETLERHFAFADAAVASNQIVAQNLGLLADVLERPNEAGSLSSFVAATEKATNRVKQRIDRFVWLCRALTEPLKT